MSKNLGQTSRSKIGLPDQLDYKRFIMGKKLEQFHLNFFPQRIRAYTVLTVCQTAWLLRTVCHAVWLTVCMLFKQHAKKVMLFKQHESCCLQNAETKLRLFALFLFGFLFMCKHWSECFLLQRETKQTAWVLFLHFANSMTHAV